MKRLFQLAIVLIVVGVLVCFALRYAAKGRGPRSQPAVIPEDPRFAAPEPAPANMESMTAEAGVLTPDEVLAEDRDDGIPAPLQAVAEPMGEAAGEAEAPEAPQDSTSELTAEPARTMETAETDSGGQSEVSEPAAGDTPEPEVARLSRDDSDAEAPAAEQSMAGDEVLPADDYWASTSERAHEEATIAEQPSEGRDDTLVRALDHLAEREQGLSAVEVAPMPAEPEGSMIPPSEPGDAGVAPEPPPEAELPIEAPEPEGTISAPEEASAEVELLSSVEEALTDSPPPTVTTAASRDAESYLDEGNVYFNVGQYGLAIDRYTKAVEQSPGLTAAFYNRANARTRAGDYDGALSDYDRALDLHPNDADALNNRGMLHLYRSDNEKALSDFNGALAADPGDMTVMVNRGLAHLHGNDAAAALADFSEAASLDSNDGAAHYGAGQAAAVLGRREEAIRYLRRALELDPAYAREAAADAKLESLQGDEGFTRMLRDSGAKGRAR